jgi:hypothetical protein
MTAYTLPRCWLEHELKCILIVNFGPARLRQLRLVAWRLVKHYRRMVALYQKTAYEFVYKRTKDSRRLNKGWKSSILPYIYKQLCKHNHSRLRIGMVALCQNRIFEKKFQKPNTKFLHSKDQLLFF